MRAMIVIGAGRASVFSLCWAIVLGCEPAEQTPFLPPPPPDAGIVLPPAPRGEPEPSPDTPWSWAPGPGLPAPVPLTDVVEVAAGAGSSCALRRDGTMWCWGEDLGLDDNSIQYERAEGREQVRATQVEDLTGVAALGLGFSTCAVMMDRTVRCVRTFGEPRLVAGVEDVEQLSLGGVHCAVIGDGSVRCWSSAHAERNEGEGPRTIAGVEDAVQVAVAVRTACALERSGRLRCWDLPNNEVSAEAWVAYDGPALPDIQEIGGRGSFTCARLGDGTVSCWDRQDGGDEGFQPVPGVTGATRLAVGYAHACALREDGSVWCWGANHAGQLGRGTLGTDAGLFEAGPVRGLPGPVVGIAAGWHHGCAVVEGGEVYCWGDNDAGQAGAGFFLKATPVRVDAVTDASHLFVDSERSCAIRSGGQVACWGKVHEPRCDPVPVAVDGLADVQDLASSRGTTCGLHRDGTVTCWQRYQRVEGAEDGRVAPVGEAPTPELPEVRQLVASYRRFCARVADGGVLCWTVGGPEDAPAATAIAGFEGARDVALGYQHDCAVMADGTVRCYGNNDNGQAGGAADRAEVPAPRLVPGLDRVTDVEAGAVSTCALREDGGVWCWGRHISSFLDEPQPVPQRVDLPRAARRITIGSSHVCALLDDGTARCWGENWYGEHGAGVLSGPDDVPNTPRGLDDLVEIVAGADRTCAVIRGGAVACWGQNRTGAVGAEGLCSAPTPRRVQR